MDFTFILCHSTHSLSFRHQSELST